MVTPAISEHHPTGFQGENPKRDGAECEKLARVGSKSRSDVEAEDPTESRRGRNNFGRMLNRASNLLCFLMVRWPFVVIRGGVLKILEF